VIFALLVVILFIWLGNDDDGSAVTTVTTTATTTTVPPTTTTAPATTTSSEATTTSAAPTTTIPFEGDTSPKINETASGTPGPNLTDVRIGDHPEDGFVRVVFDLTGEGTPFYVVGYQDPPFSDMESEVAVDGTAFIHVTISPALTFDIDTFEPTYTGDDELFPGFDPITEIQFLTDFEATLEWVIGLSAERPFTVEILQDPLRVVIDIAK
jgi:hypothetical protein